jgi:hypothetical protein
MGIVESVRAVKWPRKRQPRQGAHRYGEHVLPRLRG